MIPRGALVRYREWYGSPGKPGEGLRLDAEAGGARHRRARGRRDDRLRRRRPLDLPQDGGPSIAERMARAGGQRLRPADNTRVGKAGALAGWDQMRARIDGDGGRPMLYVFETCRDFIRTVPVLQHDPARPEDLDTGARGPHRRRDPLRLPLPPADRQARRPGGRIPPTAGSGSGAGGRAPWRAGRRSDARAISHLEG